ERRLVAYVVPEAASPQPAWRRRLEAQLPVAMVPAVFVELKALPVTSSGKVDRGALPAPAATRPALAGAYTAPRTAAERAIAEIWSEVLRVSPVGVDDGFFELGGDSLLAVRVVARASQALGVELPLSALFEAPTVAGLGSVARAKGAEATRSS